jgi:hypothetical protein
MKTKMTFEVDGSNKVEIERKTLSVIANFLGIEPDEVETKCDIEMHIELSILSGGYKAIVYVRVK